jgi:hypothetical protein
MYLVVCIDSEVSFAQWLSRHGPANFEVCYRQLVRFQLPCLSYVKVDNRPVWQAHSSTFRLSLDFSNAFLIEKKSERRSLVADDANLGNRTTSWQVTTSKARPDTCRGGGQERLDCVLHSRHGHVRCCCRSRQNKDRFLVSMVYGAGLCFSLARVSLRVRKKGRLWLCRKPHAGSLPNRQPGPSGPTFSNPGKKELMDSRPPEQLLS